MKITYVLTGVLLYLLAVPCIAQIDQGNFVSATTVDKSTANYYFAKPNELTIIVKLIGFVQRPGRYEMSNTIDLPNLISLAGGPTADGSLSDIEVFRMLKTETRLERKEIAVDLEKIVKSKPDDLALQPGDFIRVNRTNWSIFRDAFGIVVNVAIIVSAVATAIYATRYAR